MFPNPIINQYGNYVAPPSYKVLLSMHDFSSTADIKDKSTNNITITNAGAVGVGSNSYGTYMNFPGTSTSYISFKDTRLDIGSNMELYYKISGLVFRSNQYATLLMDTRPVGTNGNYLIVAYNANETAPFKTIINVNNTGSTTSTKTLPADTTIPVEIRIQMLSTGTKLYVNDVLFNDSTQILNVVNQYFNIGKNAFSGTASTPYLSAQIYKFEVRQLLS